MFVQIPAPPLPPALPPNKSSIAALPLDKCNRPFDGDILLPFILWVALEWPSLRLKADISTLRLAFSP